MTDKTGGPAFPPSFETDPDTCSQRLWDGMTLLDYFAGQALAGLIAGRSWGTPTPDDIYEQWSKAAYGTAAAMIEERERFLE